MEAIQQNRPLIGGKVAASELLGASNSVSLSPYLSLIVNTLSDFSNELFPYSKMLEIGEKEIELLLVAKKNNPGKINIERLAPRYIRLAVLNAMNKFLAL